MELIHGRLDQILRLYRHRQREIEFSDFYCMGIIEITKIQRIVIHRKGNHCIRSRSIGVVDKIKEGIVRIIYLF